MDQLACAKAVAKPIQNLGSKFMMDPTYFESAPEVGMEPSAAYYIVGRFGHLSDVSGTEVAQVATFIEPTACQQAWDEAVAKGVDVQMIADKFMEWCGEWGRLHLAGKEGLDTIANLGGKVVGAATHDYIKLFMRIKEVDRPTDAEALASVITHLLRELRFGHHVKAVGESELSPIEVIISTADGEATAKMFMWNEPFPEVTDDLRAKRQAVEEQTDKLSAEDFGVLDEGEREELAGVVQQINDSFAD